MTDTASDDVDWADGLEDDFALSGRRIGGSGKWRTAASGGLNGYQVVPDVLLRNQATLGLTETEFVVLLNITMHWWRPEDLPFPTVSTIAKRMGRTPRTVQRTIARLADKKILQREKTWPKAGGTLAERRRCFDLEPLVEKLEELALGETRTRQIEAPF